MSVGTWCLENPPPYVQSLFSENTLRISQEILGILFLEECKSLVEDESPIHPRLDTSGPHK